jgi:Arc/MetJ-type ribon-helix-helix transcriptional regulator
MLRDRGSNVGCRGEENNNFVALAPLFHTRHPILVPRYSNSVLHDWQRRNTLLHMKTLTVRLPEPLVAEIEAESRGRRCSKSDIVRERLQRAARPRRRQSTPLDAIADLIGSVDGLPADLSARKKRYLKATGYGQKRAR